MSIKRTLTTIAIMGVAGLAFGQGSLTPPGAPGATMKTLNQVEPRTPISSAPYTISQSGSYYLTTNLTSTGHGIVIEASDVTLDLMGFTLSGDRGTSDYGVYLDGATNSVIESVVVRNGIVRSFDMGIRAEYIQNSRFENIITTTNKSYGVFLTGFSAQCNGNSIANCTISGNGSHGVRFYGQCNNNTIADCIISGNESSGVFFYGFFGQCDNNTIANCTIGDNGSYGVGVDSCSGNTLVGCRISGNGDYGIYLNGSFSGQCAGNSIDSCTISGNADNGIYLYGYDGQCEGNSIVDCMIRGNTDRGIYLNYADGNRVEGNHVAGQTGAATDGIRCGGSENLVLRNMCVGQTNNFSVYSSNTYGPIVTSSGALSTTNGAAALSPWANFSR